MTSPSTAEVRAWARQKGLAVGDRGRLSPDLVARYVAEARGESGAAPAPTEPAPRQQAEPAPAPRTNPPVRSARNASGRRPGPGVVRARTPWNWPVLEAENGGRSGRTTRGRG